MRLVKKGKDDFIKIKVQKLIDRNEPNGEGCIVSDKIIFLTNILSINLLYGKTCIK